MRLHILHYTNLTGGGIIRLLDLVLQEYFAIVEHLKSNMNLTEDKIVIDNTLFYAFLDKKLYLKRSKKLEIYKQLNLITCNSKGFTSVVYDKETKKSTRKIIINVKTYDILKKLYLVELKM